MTLTAAQKQRNYRQRLKENPEKYASYLEKEKKRWKERVQAGKVKKVADYSAREHRHVKKLWRERQKRCRAKKNIPLPLTPPILPVNVDMNQKIAL